MRHPVVVTLSVALVFVACAIYFIERQRAVSPTGGSATWGRIGAYFEPEPVTPTESTTFNDPEPIESAPETLAIPAATPTPAKPKPAKVAVDDGTFDYNAMLAALRHDPTAPAQQASKSFEQLLDSFSFAPVLPEPEQKKRTPEQDALFAYGNEIGIRLKAFAAVNMNMGQIVGDQINHRNDRSKGDAVRDLGSRYKTLGEGILAFRDIPPAAEDAHQKLGKSYVQLGEALAKVPDATTDQELLAAITAYNNKADAYTSAFVGMVTLFNTLNVTFQETDGGSVFSFQRN